MAIVEIPICNTDVFDDGETNELEEGLASFISPYFLVLLSALDNG
jgi:hypothetical protein